MENLFLMLAFPVGVVVCSYGLIRGFHAVLLHLYG